MDKFGILFTLTLLVLAISEVSAICCGRGKHGFCNDCSIARLSHHRKCCGAGSGYGQGCNIFCCNCGKCRKGHRTISLKSGWFLHKRYTCLLHHNGSESEGTVSLQDTWNVFNAMDQNNDASIAPYEFLHALRLRLSDEENAHIMASHLLNSNDQDKVVSFLDVVNDNEMNRENKEDFARMIVDEFKKLDENADGLIQPGEFDKDLKDELQKGKKNTMSDLVSDLISQLE